MPTLANASREAAMRKAGHQPHSQQQTCGQRSHKVTGWCLHHIRALMIYNNHAHPAQAVQGTLEWRVWSRGLGQNVAMVGLGSGSSSDWA